MSEIGKHSPHAIHPDFPNQASGETRPRESLRGSDSASWGGPRWSAEEIMHRFAIAEIVTDQLANDFERKKAESSEWTDDERFAYVRDTLMHNTAEGWWPVSEAEQTWILNRVRERCIEMPAGMLGAKHLMTAFKDKSVEDALDDELPISLQRTCSLRQPERLSKSGIRLRPAASLR